jgi:hypothetical protein
MNVGYISGFFDGEGTLSTSCNRWRISIPQTNYLVLDEIRKFVGFGSIYKTKKKKEHHKDAWVYTITNSKDVLDFLIMIEPFIIVKKEFINEQINILKNKKINDIIKINERSDQRNKVIELKESGLSYRKIEKIMGFSRQKVCRLLSETV